MLGQILYEHVRDIDGWPLSGCRHSRVRAENCDVTREYRGNDTQAAMCQGLPQDDQEQCQAAGCDYDAAEDGTCRVRSRGLTAATPYGNSLLQL